MSKTKMIVVVVEASTEADKVKTKLHPDKYFDFARELNNHGK